MESKIKEWIDIYAKITEVISDPIIMLDSSFDIINANQNASSIFYIDDFTLNLDQVFDESTSRNLIDAIGPVLFTNLTKFIKDFPITTKTGESSQFELNINPIEINGKKFIVLIFNNKTANSAENSIDKIQLRLGKYFHPEVIEKFKLLVSEIEKIIPFTIVGLRQLQSIIDEYNFPIWIKDLQARFISINTSYSELLGIENSLAPGKKQESFLPVHLVPIYRSLDEYIFNTSNPIILEGFGKKVGLSEVIHNTIQIPLLDKRNKLYAVIGLINDNKIEQNSGAVIPNFSNMLINRLPKAAALINSYGKIEQANIKFCKFLDKDSENIIDKNFVDLFPYLISENIKSFIKNDLDSDEIFIGKSLDPVDYSSRFATISLLKILSKDNVNQNIIIIIDDSEKIIQEEEELQNIIKNRGKMFEVLIQNNPDPIFIYDKENLKFLEVNEAAIKFYGFSKDEFLQMDLTDLYAPEDIQTLLDSFGDERSEGKFSKPFRHRKKDGSTAVVEISKTSFHFNDKEAHFNIVKDITSSIEKDKQNQMLKVIFNATDSLVINTDASGFITSINYPVIEKLGYTSNELLKSSFTSLVIDDDRAIINTSIFQTPIRDEVSLDTKIKKHDGEFIEVEITASPIIDFNNEIESFTLIAKPAKYVIKQETPKEIIKEVIKEVIVEKPSDSSLKPNVPDANFLSGMFHEILTPINVIIGFAQELISNVKNPTDEQREAAEIINQNRIKMMDTMNAVVEYSEIVQNKSIIKIEDITITDIVDVLDKKIKDITGINDIQFGYGKISSSLRFKSDKQKFESLIFSLIKVISRISKDKKVYFSAYSIDSDKFIMGLSDQYGSSSETVANVFDMVFNQERDPKDFGLPKLTTYLAKLLLSLLGGKYSKSIVGSLRQESGFLFPQILAAKGGKTFDELKIDSINYDFSKDENFKKTSDKLIMESPASEQISETQNLQEPQAEEYKEEIYSPDKEEGDIFKPVTPIAEELLSKINEEPPASEMVDESAQSESKDLAEEINVPKAEEMLEVSDVQNVPFETGTPFVPPLPQLNLANLSCLYIEDQVDSQILFKVQMKGLKDVKFAVSFEESQPLLLNSQFDFIVMDINLQGEYNGLDALKIIKTIPALHNIPIIAVTAYVLPGDKEKFIVAGFDDFISKPIFREKMMESLKKIFLSKY